MHTHVNAKKWPTLALTLINLTQRAWANSPAPPRMSLLSFVNFPHWKDEIRISPLKRHRTAQEASGERITDHGISHSKNVVVLK